jgi:hypothetical protein
MGESHEWGVAHSSRGRWVLGIPDGDQNIEFQQNISKRRLGAVVLRAHRNALEDLLPLVPVALNRDRRRPTGTGGSC